MPFVAIAAAITANKGCYGSLLWVLNETFNNYSTPLLIHKKVVTSQQWYKIVSYCRTVLRSHTSSNCTISDYQWPWMTLKVILATEYFSKRNSFTTEHTLCRFCISWYYSKNIKRKIAYIFLSSSFSFRVAHAPFPCQHWGLPHRLAQCTTPGKGLV